MLRRAGVDAGLVIYGPLRVDFAGRRVWVEGAPISLTGKEFDILACLSLEPGRAVSREEIFDRVWDEHWYGPRKVLDVHVCRAAPQARHPGVDPNRVWARGSASARPPATAP